MAPGVQLEKEQRMGFFQTILVVLIFLPLLMVASHNFLQNFTAAVPRHWCYIPAGDNDTTEVTGDLLKIYIPMDGNQEPDRCLRFSTPQWQLLAPNGTSTNATEPCLDGWVYDRSVFNSTIITEWHLVCGQRALKDFAQSIYMAGVLVGALVYGGLADRLGRRALLLWSLLQMGVMGTGAAFAPNLAAYCAFRFFSGMGTAGSILNGSSLTLEWIPSRFRAMVYTILACSLTLGQLLLAGLAYAIRDWRQLQLASSNSWVLCLSLGGEWGLVVRGGEGWVSSRRVLSPWICPSPPLEKRCDFSTLLSAPTFSPSPDTAAGDAAGGRELRALTALCPGAVPDSAHAWSHRLPHAGLVRGSPCPHQYPQANNTSAMN
uniref:Major facilitator superfamily (MFS) profile domain-containing protein n=1 Tax=Terrapene triunguis TaxID=2587831 RepID=A0A674I4T6_9SAUR